MRIANKTTYLFEIVDNGGTLRFFHDAEKLADWIFENENGKLDGYTGDYDGTTGYLIKATNLSIGYSHTYADAHDWLADHKDGIFGHIEIGEIYRAKSTENVTCDNLKISDLVYLDGVTREITDIRDGKDGVLEINLDCGETLKIDSCFTGMTRVNIATMQAKTLRDVYAFTGQYYRPMFDPSGLFIGCDETIDRVILDEAEDLIEIEYAGGELETLFGLDSTYVEVARKL